MLPLRRGLAQEEPRDLLCTLRGVRIALAGGDDRALHEDVPFAREIVGIRHIRLGRELPEELADTREVGGAGLPDRILAVTVLEHHVDERAALEVARVE